MARGIRTVYTGKRNKGLSSTFQPPEEGRSVQWPKRCDKHGDKDEDNSPKNVNNVQNTSSQKYRQRSKHFWDWQEYSKEFWRPEGTCCHSAFDEGPSIKTVVKNSQRLKTSSTLTHQSTLEMILVLKYYSRDNLLNSQFKFPIGNKKSLFRRCRLVEIFFCWMCFCGDVTNFPHI